MPTPRDIATDQDWTTFRNPTLRDAHNNPQKEFRTSALGETSGATRRPVTPTQALMETAPGDAPETSLEEVQPLREAVAAAESLLTEEHRYIIDAIHHEGLSYSQLAERLGVGKTQAHRLTKIAEAELRAVLLLDPTITERIQMTETWNDAARERVTALATVGSGLDDDVARSLIERKIAEVQDEIRDQRPPCMKIVHDKLVTIGRAAADMLSNRGMWNIEEMTQLLCRKQHDYGYQNILAFGMTGVGVRCSDKVARFVNLTDKDAAGTAEPLEDALLDMVGYAVIAMMLQDDKFLLELEWPMTCS